MTDLDLTGATVLVVQPGERLVFVTTRADHTLAEVQSAHRPSSKAVPK